jgi:RNA polymerase sigma-70 factor (ECF subfamily)
MSALVEVFIATLPACDAETARGDAKLEPALAEAIARGAAAHPAIAVAATTVADFLGTHADEARAPSDWLPTRNVADVHLVCGILRGNPAALAELERRIVPELHAAVRRLLGNGDRAGEIVAAVREKLVVGVDARGPRIADYGGHGELAVWMRVVAIRAALDELRRTQRMVAVDDHLWEVASPSLDPALALVKRESAALIKAAFHVGLMALSPRQRNLLRQHLIDGLTIDELGVIYQVHRVTAARWLAAARADLWSHTRRQLRETLRLSDSAIGNMLDEIRSTLDLSIERALG